MNLFTRSFLTSVVPLVLLGVLTTAVLWKSIFPAVQDSVFQMAQEKQRTTRAQVADFISSRQNLLESIARNEVLTSGPSPEAMSYLKTEHAALPELFEGLYYNSLDGIVTSTEGSQFSVTDRPYYERVKIGEPVIGEVLTSRATSQRILLMVVPIQKDGRLVAALGGTVLVSDLLKSITPSPEPLNLQVGLLQGGDVLEGFSEAAMIRQFPEAYTPEGCKFSNSGEPHRAWAFRLPEVPWDLVVAWPEREMLAPLHQALTAGISSFVLIFLLAAGFSFGLQQSITRPLQRAAELLQDHQLGGPLKLNTEGPREVTMLLQRVNEMAGRVSREMSRRLELEQQLAKAVYQERLGTLADSIAHDFHNVLSAIINLADFCLERAEDDEQLRDDLGTIVQSAQTGISMVDQLRRKAVESRHEPEPLNFDSDFKQWMETFRALLPPGITLKADLSAENSTTRAVSHHLFQVMLNLICNARDAMACQSSGEILVLSSIQDGRLVVEVKDNGPGIPKELEERIFEPFFTTREDGSGLGLSTCYRLVNEMKATIELIPGDRTCFRFSLPIWDHPAS
ncbi:MAG: ATP-binding protein [Vulcanimicrobiota bacterium]